jgi:hypothetical protein
LRADAWIEHPCAVELGGFRYPGETFVIAVVLGFLPYLVLRGPITRIARRFVDSK